MSTTDHLGGYIVEDVPPAPVQQPLVEEYPRNNTISNIIMTEKEYEERRSRRELVFVVALAIVIVTAVVASVSVVVIHAQMAPPFRMQSSSSTTVHPTVAPSMAPTTVYTNAAAKLESIRNLIVNNSYTVSYAAQIPTTINGVATSNINPFAHALDWLLHNDTRLVNSKNVARRFALAFVYFNNNGAYWNNRTNWIDPAVHHCAWAGVFCCGAFTHGVAPTCQNASSDVIVELNLSRNNVSKSISVMMSLLTDLRSLDLSYNRLTGAIPSQALGSLPNFMSLYLQHNALSGHLNSSLRDNGILSKFTRNRGLTFVSLCCLLRILTKQLVFFHHPRHFLCTTQ
jgi:hypothetical protein